MRSVYKCRGFTLLELSVAMVIIALLIGGVFVAQSLIRSAQLNSVVTEVTRYTQAIEDFRDKYQALPGDFAGAEALWGSDASCPNTPYTLSPHTATCNGNGDGFIAYNDGATVTNGYEIYRAWQELADAGFISGAFTGVTGPNSSFNALIGINVPASQVPGAGYAVVYFYLPTGTGWAWPTLAHVFQFGAGSTANPYVPVLTPAEAFAIDTKIDDGLPAYGKVMTYLPVAGGNPNCTTSSSQATSAYNTGFVDIACALIFVMDF